MTENGAPMSPVLLKLVKFSLSLLRKTDVCPELKNPTDVSKHPVHLCFVYGEEHDLGEYSRMCVWRGRWEGNGASVECGGR